MVWYLVGAVVPVNVDVVHDAGVVTFDCLGHYPLEVPAGRVGFRVGGDVPDDGTDGNDDLKHTSEAILLLIVIGPEGNIPQESSSLEDAKPGQDE